MSEETKLESVGHITVIDRNLVETTAKIAAHLNFANLFIAIAEAYAACFSEDEFAVKSVRHELLSMLEFQCIELQKRDKGLPKSFLDAFMAHISRKLSEDEKQDIITLCKKFHPCQTQNN